MSDLQVGEVCGSRLFHATEDGRLVSYSAGYTWKSGPNEAACLRPKRPGHGAIPALDCGCGFWVYRDLDRCARTFRGELLDQSEGNPFGSFEPKHYAVLGECLGWGRVLVGTDGWRAEWARVHALVDIGQGIDLTPWADAYAVPVVASRVNLSLVRTGRLTAHGEAVSGRHRTSIWVDDTLYVVRMDSLAFLELWKIPVGTLVRIALHPDTGEVAAVRVCEEPDA